MSAHAFSQDERGPLMVMHLMLASGPTRCHMCGHCEMPRNLETQAGTKGDKAEDDPIIQGSGLKAARMRKAVNVLRAVRMGKLFPSLVPLDVLACLHTCDLNMSIAVTECT
eukprot:5657538-Pyramimonas_sp.AAC.1